MAAKDRAVGKLTSREFTIERRFISFWIGGGKARSPSRLGLTLLVDGQPVQTAAGEDQNQMALKHFDVSAWAGKTARLEILDDATGGWGNVGVGKIVFTDQPADAGPLEELPDFGTMALALLGAAAGSGQRRPDRAVLREIVRRAGPHPRPGAGRIGPGDVRAGVAFSESLAGRALAEGGTLIMPPGFLPRTPSRNMSPANWTGSAAANAVVARHLV